MMSVVTVFQFFSVVSFFVTTTVGDSSAYCDRPWPAIELFMPYKLHTSKRERKYNELEALFLRSFLLFWPLKLSNVSLTIGIDEEKNMSINALEVKATLQRLNIPGGAKLAQLPTSSYYRSGYDRQQHVMMWADNFTDKEYIGFVDSDAVFLTYIDREDLFEDGKPVVNARSGYHRTHKDNVNLWSAGSYETLGFLEPFKCMSYFPVIVKRAHLKEMRDFIMERHNLTFDDAFYQNISAQGLTHQKSFSQFGIMCSYLYRFKREEYKWYVHSESPTWDGVRPAPPYGQDGNVSQFTAQMNLPKPRITTHAGYRRTPSEYLSDIHKPVEMNNFLQLGYCLSPPFPKTESECLVANREVLKLGYYDEMHIFDLVDYVVVNNVSVLQQQYQERYERIKNCTHIWDQKEMHLLLNATKII